MAEQKYVSPENLEAVETELKSWIIGKVKTAVDQLIDGAPEAYDTLKEISEYISSHTNEYDALIALVGDKASKTDLTELQTTVASLQKQLSTSSHSHSNKTILDETTASFTSDLLKKLNGLSNYDDSGIKKDITDLKDNKHNHSNKLVLDKITASYTLEEQTKLSGIDEGANKTIVDTELDETSENPVQNKTVATKLKEQEETIKTLQEDVDNIALSLQPMTNEEVNEMFDRVFNGE